MKWDRALLWDFGVLGSGSATPRRVSAGGLTRYGWHFGESSTVVRLASIGLAEVTSASQVGHLVLPAKRHERYSLESDGPVGRALAWAQHCTYRLEEKIPFDLQLLQCYSTR